MHTTPSVMVFDVNETLSDMAPIAMNRSAIGAPAHVAKVWFAQLLRDGFALAATGHNVAFADIGADVLRGLLHEVSLTRGLDESVEHVMQGMAELDLHPDVPAGIQALNAAGFRVVTLSNGSPDVAEKLFAAAGIRDEFERLLSVQDAPAWKPHRSSYDHAAQVCGVRPEEMMLVAVHPWDIHGAASAGLSTAWINRAGVPYPSFFHAPDHTINSLEELAEVQKLP